jgi:hypothetical protein
MVEQSVDQVVRKVEEQFLVGDLVHLDHVGVHQLVQDLRRAKVRRRRGR